MTMKLMMVRLWIPLILLASAFFLICVGCGSKQAAAPVAGGATATRITNNPAAPPQIKAQAQAQQQIAQHMQQIMAQQSQAEQVASRKKQ